MTKEVTVNPADLIVCGDTKISGEVLAYFAYEAQPNSVFRFVKKDDDGTVTLNHQQCPATTLDLGQAELTLPVLEAALDTLRSYGSVTLINPGKVSVFGLANDLIRRKRSEHTFIRQCPKCGGDVKHSSYQGWWLSKRQNRRCRSCAYDAKKLKYEAKHAKSS